MYDSCMYSEALTVEYEKGLLASQNPSLYLVPDGVFLVACFALTYGAHNGSKKSARGKINSYQTLSTFPFLFVSAFSKL